MPTAAKLVSFIYFAVLGYVLAQMVQHYTALGMFRPVLLPTTVFGFFSLVCAAVGGLCGWFVVGQVAGHPRGGRAMRRTVAFGLRTSVTMLFFGVLVFALREMLILAMQLRYDGPIEALQAMVGLMVSYAEFFLMPVLGVVLVTGGMFGGVVAELTAKVWR